MPSKKHQSSIENNSAFMVKMEDLVKEIIIQNDIPYYRIESRMDHQQNATGENVYLPIVRVITYFEDSVSKISDIICAEFDVVNERSKDKKKIRLDSFSYKHVQYVASLKPARQELIEYRRSGDKKFEVQVCSMLQDAWAGIEKELGYDNATFPDEMKRDFYRVGALLEMADLEFLKIRSQLSAKYGWADQEAETSIEETIAKTETVKAEVKPEATPINGAPKQTTAPIGPNGMPLPAGMPQPFMPQPGMPFPGMPNGNGMMMPGQPYFPQQMPMNGFGPFGHMMGNYMPQYDPNMGYMHPQYMQMPQYPGQQYMPQQQVDPMAYAAQQQYMAQPVVPQPEPASQPEPEATVTEEPVAHEAEPIQAPMAEHNEVVNQVADAVNGSVSLDTIDMNVDKPNTLALNINEIEETKGLNDGSLPDMVAGIPANLNVQPLNNEVAPVNGTNNGSDSVALNIDKVDTFNMNVNGMIERRTEIVTDNREKNEENIPFYEREAKPAKSSMLDENAQMTDAMLKEYVSNSKLVKEVDSEVARRSGATLNAEVDVEGDVERLKFLKVYSLKQLHERIMDNKNDIIAFAEKWIGSDNGGSFDSGICLFYLEYLLVGKRNDPAFAVEYVLKFISDNDYSARFIIPTYNSISKMDKPIGAHLTLK